MTTSPTVKPVFIKARDIPDATNVRPSVLELCLAAERETGQGTVVGAQAIGGLWRIYPESDEARTQLLIRGIKLRNTSIQPSSTNPFIVRDSSGEERQATKVWIDDIPISVADSVIEVALKKLGCELRSAVIKERARDADHKLTRFLTGRRYIFITVPTKPLEKSIKIDFFSAKIYHKEQKQTQTTPHCSKCLSEGHHVSQCKGKIVCITCKKPGHKRGDPECSLGNPNNRKVTDEARGARTLTSKVSEKSDQERGRKTARQTTLRPAWGVHCVRSRSETPNKRRLSGETTSETTSPDTKQARHDNAAQATLQHSPSPHRQPDTQGEGDCQWG